MAVIFLITAHYPNTCARLIQRNIPSSGTKFFVAPPLFDCADGPADPSSIVMAVGSIVSSGWVQNKEQIDEIKHKTKSNFLGATILFKLGVPIEPPSRSGSLSSNESTPQEKVYSVL